MVARSSTSPVLTTNKEGREFLDTRAVELKRDGITSPSTRAVFQAIVRDVRPKYLTEYGPRDTIGILDIAHNQPIQIEYTYDRTSLHKSLRKQSIKTGRTAPPSGNVSFDTAFNAAWKLLADTLDEYNSNPAS